MKVQNFKQWLVVVLFINCVVRVCLWGLEPALLFSTECALATPGAILWLYGVSISTVLWTTFHLAWLGYTITAVAHINRFKYTYAMFSIHPNSTEHCPTWQDTKTLKKNQKVYYRVNNSLHWSLSLARWILSTYPHPIQDLFNSILITTYTLALGATQPCIQWETEFLPPWCSSWSWS
jgi:hypothetical protein